MIEKMTGFSFIMLKDGSDAFLNRLKELGVVDITRSAKAVDEVSLRLATEISSTKKRISELNAGKDSRLEELVARQKELEKELGETEPWGDFDRKKLEGLGLPVRFFCTGRKRFNPEWKEEYPLVIAEETEKSVYYVIVGDAADFPEKDIPAPARKLSEIRADIEENRLETENYRKELERCKADIPALEKKAEDIAGELELHLAKAGGEEAAESHLTVYEGFAPEKDETELCEELDRMDIIYLKYKATAEDNPPIEFRNNRFVKLFEPLTDMYGRPSYDGFDPTPYISVFFLLFFAMCMGDAGYGIILVIGGLLLGKVRSFASLAPLVTVLGIGTVIVGFFFHTFFSIDISSWEWIPESIRGMMVPSKVAGYDGTMVLGRILGIIHLCLAIIVKTVYATRNKGFLNSLGVWGWTLLIVGGVVTGGVWLTGVLDSATVKVIIMVLGAVSAIGIFFLNDLHGNPLKNVGSGLWEAYNTATGLLGDVLSYLRLYALGLAGGMLGYAFNDLAEMALGDGGFRWVFFILIVIIGHTLNLAMAALGAFVHPLRLNFLEFFKNSGYEGSGRRYKPIK